MGYKFDNQNSIFFIINNHPIIKMPCSHCGLSGHNIQTCRVEGAEESRQRRSQERDQREQARREVVERVQRAQRELQARDAHRAKKFPTLYVFNNNPYRISLYYCRAGEDETSYRYWTDIEEMGQIKINQDSPDSHLFFIPSSLCLVEGQMLGSGLRAPRFSVEEMNTLFVVTDVIFGRNNVRPKPNNEIYLLREFIVPKTPIEQWKECSLKSLFLLDQLITLGAKSNDNYEMILDLVQDIPVPQHEELDRENAGVPSAFTNITNQTHINEPA
jgi:hypothetical protein